MCAVDPRGYLLALRRALGDGRHHTLDLDSGACSANPSSSFRWRRGEIMRALSCGVAVLLLTGVMAAPAAAKIRGGRVVDHEVELRLGRQPAGRPLHARQPRHVGLDHHLRRDRAGRQRARPARAGGQRRDQLCQYRQLHDERRLPGRDHRALQPTASPRAASRSTTRSTRWTSTTTRTPSTAASAASTPRSGRPRRSRRRIRSASS